MLDGHAGSEGFKECWFFAEGKCTRGIRCPYRHGREDGRVLHRALPGGTAQARKVCRRTPVAAGAGVQGRSSEDQPASEAQDCDWERYAAALCLEASPHRSLPIAVLVEPTVSAEDCDCLEAWQRERRATRLPNGLVDLGRITLEDLDTFSGWSVVQECKSPLRSCRCAVLCTAVQHLREQVDVRNRHGLRRTCFLKALRALWRGRPPAAELARIVESQFGVSGFSFAEALAVDVLPGGAKAFKAGLEGLRRTAPDKRSAALEACARSADESPLDTLVYLARHSVEHDWQAEADGSAGETSVEQLLREAGMELDEFVTEKQQRDLQLRLFSRIRFPTPDLLFRRPVLLSGTPGPFRWVDVKNTVVVPGCTMSCRAEKNLAQARKYVDLLGPGALLWVRGYPQSLPTCDHVSYLQLEAHRVGRSRRLTP